MATVPRQADDDRDMADPRLPLAAPSVAPPPPFADRRQTFRREADRIAHEETRLLARALDILARDVPAEARLAGILDLLAETVGADRAAVVADGAQRRVAVVAAGPDDEPGARDLAAWLDAAAPRSRARRAAAGPAPVSVVIGRARRGGAAEPWFDLLSIPSAGEVSLGFAFAAPIDPGTLADRLPPALARHAAVALALVTDAMATARALAELRAGEAERDRFVSTVAHELRTPLTGLSGYLDLILEGRVDDREVEREFLERGRTIVGSMAGLVGDLLEMSRLDAGSIRLEATPFSLAEAMSGVGSSLLPIAMERGVDLQIDAPPRMRTAFGDRRRVEQILVNLAGNALKFGRNDGHGIVELAAAFDGAVACIAVRDDGEGIEAEDRPRIFERFYRMVGHERVTGTGLGLPIARELARVMGGDLDVASLPGTGSTFVLALPTLVGAEDDGDAVRAAMARQLAAETDRLTTLASLRAGQQVRASAAADERRGRGRKTDLVPARSGQRARLGGRIIATASASRP
jgi:signal transduction histidine kinase